MYHAVQDLYPFLGLVFIMPTTVLGENKKQVPSRPSDLVATYRTTVVLLSTAEAEVWKTTVSLSSVGVRTEELPEGAASSVMLSVVADGVVDAFSVDAVAPVDGVAVVSVAADTDGVGVVDLNPLH